MKISDLEILRKLRLKYLTSPQLDYFVISETKLDPRFSSAQFHLGDHEITNCRDRDKSGGGLIEFVKKEIITKRLNDLEINLNETICTEITISQKRWFCISVYRQPSS